MTFKLIVDRCVTANKFKTVIPVITATFKGISDNHVRLQFAVSTNGAALQ